MVTGHSLSGAEPLAVGLDFRGWGESTGPKDAKAYTISAITSDIDVALTNLRLERVVLLDLSIGAKVAQILMTLLPASALRGLVLVSPAPATPCSLPSDMSEQQMHAYDNAESAEFVARNVLMLSFRLRDLPDFVVDDMLRGNR
ncbi:hypothetical protein NKR19_g3946 [Coniochaeta hoffmannii]|uniref:AB hydrolase-1 domain-containing protein n=1 Tax=Coniochaeta hoffmannii TaxID=91930 RepID=A0AA38S688_9PEZI|nr:hypothetical protein NKR19_g3946 [Coniochaeta hoffmannii]